MIITISGANFSASNIGTLSTWTVSKSIGAGAEHSIPSYVDKNSAFNYTITLKDGYTFGTYNVTMGGQTITPTVTETSMTINIASVTGAIRIEVKTINSSTGEEDKPVTPKPDQPGTGGGSVESGTQLISAFRNNSANAQYIHDGTYKVVDGEVSFAGNGKTYKYFILPLNVFNITDLKCVTGLKDANDIAPIVFLKNNEMKSENIVGDLTFGGTQKVDGVTMHTSFAYYANGFPSIPEGANYVAFSDFIDRETLKVADEKLTITFE